jgi:hypothetical protein
MPRPIYLSILRNPSTMPAHWAIFIPTTNHEFKGKLIHATGDPGIGFFLHFKRNHDFQAEDRRYQLIHLADVDERLINDAVGDGKPTEDSTARDRIESAATVVVPPGKSAKPFDPAVRENL